MDFMHPVPLQQIYGKLNKVHENIWRDIENFIFLAIKNKFFFSLLSIVIYGMSFYK